MTRSDTKVGVQRARVAAGLAVALAGCGHAGPDEAIGRTSSAITYPNDQPAFEYFVGKGLTSFQAAGIVGNLDVESGVDPTAVQSGGGRGRGIAQWSTGGRWDTDKNDNATWYAGTQGEDVWSLELQLDFIWYELTTFSYYGLTALEQTTNVSDATDVVMTKFEGCPSCDIAARTEDAENVLNAFGPGHDPCSGCGTGDNCGTAQNGGTTGTLYHCVSGVTSSSKVCPNGCTVEPMGTNDICTPAPADAGASDAAVPTDARAHDAASWADGAAGTSDAAARTDAGAHAVSRADATKSGAGAPDDAALASAPGESGGSGGCSQTAQPGVGSDFAWLVVAVAGLGAAARRKRQAEATPGRTCASGPLAFS